MGKFENAHAIFTVQAEMDAAFTPTGRRIEASMDDAVTTARRIASEILARQAGAIMRGWLNPNSVHSVGIGWTGKAAKGLLVSSRNNKTEWFVYEKSKVLALIREGMKAHTKIQQQPIEEFETWIRDHNINEFGGKAKSGKLRKLRKSRQEELRDLAYRIRRSLYAYGGSVWWKEHVPAAKGQMNFNYAKVYQNEHARQNTEFTVHRLMLGSGTGSFRALISDVVSTALSSATKKSKWTTSTYSRQFSSEIIRRSRYSGGNGGAVLYWRSAQDILQEIQYIEEESET